MTRKEPHRPRQHATEDASRRAFERALPGEWVYRQQTHDYGIDGEVEIFSGGKATGQIFKVQLKGTTQRDLRRALVVRIPVEKESYFRSIGLPILIALYLEPPDRLFVRWFQSFNPHDEPHSDKTLTMRFTEDDVWGEHTPRRLQLDVETFYSLRDSRSRMPITLSTNRIDDTVAGVSSAEVSLALRIESAAVGDLVRFLPASSALEAMGTVHLRRDAGIVDLRGMMSSTVHYPDPWPGLPDASRVVHDVMISIGILINRLGRTDAAARLFTTFAGNSWIANQPTVILTMVGCFTRAHRIGDAIEVAESLTPADGSEVGNAMLYSLTWHALSDSLSPDDARAVVEHLMRRIEEAESGGEAKRIGTAHYNVANRLRWLGRHVEALEHFRIAAEFDPDYMKRDYYHGEMAGSLFETRDFETAAAMYGRALEMGGKARYLPLRADALMMNGHYAAALVDFSGYNADQPQAPSEWKLKQWALAHIRTAGGEVQNRREEEALHLADVSGDLTDDERSGRLRAALQVDAICPLAWFNLGIEAEKAGNFERAWQAFLVAALVQRYDTEAWNRAILMGILADSNLVPEIVCVRTASTASVSSMTS